MKELIEEFEKTGYTAWIHSDLYPNGKIYTQEFTEWLAEKLTNLQPADSPKCVKSDVRHSCLNEVAYHWEHPSENFPKWLYGEIDKYGG